MRIAIFVSGEGSNMIALAKAVRKRHLKAEIVAVICDNPKAGAIQKAKDLGLDVWIINWQKIEIEKLAEKFLTQKVSLLVLAGFMRIIPGYFLDKYGSKLINIHPSLLPKYPGLNAIERSYENGDKNIGITIHYVDEGMDTGPIIAQFETIREHKDSLEEIYHKIHRLEHENYWKTLQKVIKGEA